MSRGTISEPLRARIPLVFDDELEQPGLAQRIAAHASARDDRRERTGERADRGAPRALARNTHGPTDPCVTTSLSEPPPPLASDATLPAAIDDERLMGGPIRRSSPRLRRLTALLRNPLGILVVAMFGATGLLTGVHAMLGLGLALFGALLVLPLAPPVNRFLQKADRETQWRRAQIARARLRHYMSQMHREELTDLERRVNEMRVNGARHGTMVDLSGLDRLLGHYVRLAVTHEATSRLLASSDEQRAECLMHMYEAPREDEPQELRPLRHRYAQLLRGRRDALQELEARCRAMRYQLGIVAETGRLVHERAGLSLASRDPAQETELLSAELEAYSDLMRELCSARIQDASAMALRVCAELDDEGEEEALADVSLLARVRV